MATSDKVLCKKAKRLELKGSQKNKINPEHIPALEDLFLDFYVICRPKESDYYNRKDLVRIFNEIAKEICGKSDGIPVVVEFGSFVMDIFSAKSDLDLSVNFSNNTVDFPREKKIRTLRKFAKKFYALQRKGHVSSVHPILTARVPILKVVDHGTGIECDISIENRDGIVKSQIIRMISSIDQRFQMLSFLMKAWAKAHDINSSKERTLNSLSIILLVAFHLQTRNPPILPPFSAIFKDGTDPASVEKIVNNLLNYGKRNKESLSELFVTLLIKLASVETLWPEGLCASTYEGSWISKTWESKFGWLSVEDFTDRSQNVARAVGETAVKNIYECIHLSVQHVSDFMDGEIQGTKLRQLLFGQEPIPALVDKCTSNFDKRTVEPCISLDPTQTKKMRTTGYGGETERALPFTHSQSKNKYSTAGWGGTPTEGWGGTLTAGLGGTQQDVVPDFIWRKEMKSAEQAIPFNPIQTKNMRTTAGWGGTPTEGWGGTPTVGWGGVQLGVVPDSISRKEMKSAEGWEGTNQANSEIKIHLNSPFTSKIPYQTRPLAPNSGNTVPMLLQNLSSIHAQNQIGIEKSGGPFLQSPFLPPQNLLGFDGSRSMNVMVPVPHVGPLRAHAQPGHYHLSSGHGPHSNGYGSL